MGDDRDDGGWGVSADEAPLVAGDGGRTAVDLETVFAVLDHPRRRFVVQALVERSVWRLDTLAAEMLAAERSVEASALSAQAVERARISLVHVHAPVLAARDVARYETGSGELHAGPTASSLANILTTIEAAVAGTD